MAIITGSHWSGPVTGDNRSGGGLCEDVPLELVNRRSVITYFNDFITADDLTVGATNWVTSNVGAGTAASVGVTQDEGCGVLLVNAGTNDQEGIQAQLAGTANARGFFDPLDNGGGVIGMFNGFFAWEARIKKDVATNGALVIGFGATDITIVSAAGAVTWANSTHAFISSSGLIQMRAVAGSNLIATTNPVLANDTWTRVGARFSWRGDALTPTGGTVEFFVNGKSVGGANAGTTAMFGGAGYSPGVAVVNSVGSDMDARVDYIWCAFKRDIA